MHVVARSLARLAVVALGTLCGACGGEDRVLAREGQPTFVRLTEHVSAYARPPAAPPLWRELVRAEALPAVLPCADERRLRLEVSGPPGRKVVVTEHNRKGKRRGRHKDLTWTGSVWELEIEAHPDTMELRVEGDEGPRELRLLGAPIERLLRDRDAQYRGREGRRPVWHEQAVARVDVGQELRTSLLCLAGGHVETSLVVPDGEPQLQFHTWLSKRQPYSQVGLRVTVHEGDELRHDETFFAQPTLRWRPRSTDLGAVAGKAVRIRFEVVDPALDAERAPDAARVPPACLAVGDPVVRATAWRDPRPDLVLISLDTLRPDHLGIYGYEHDTSPRLDALAREGLVFENAWSSSSYTLPAHHSMLSGQGVANHGVYKAWDPFDPEWTPNLFETLADAGYRTLAVTAAGFLDPRAGLGRGCDVHLFDGPIRTAEDDLRHLDEILDEVGSPVAVFMHTYFVHNYDPYDRDLAFFGGDEDTRVDLLPVSKQLHDDALGPEERAALIERLVRLYDATIRGADRQLGRLFDALEAAGRLDDTLIVIVSDHGEEFDDHGDYGHGRQLYEETVRVPLILRGPGVPRGRRVTTPVSLVDVAPTIAALLGVDYDGTRVDGRPLLPLPQAPGPERPVLAEADALRAIRIGAAKALWQDKNPIHGPEGRTELFDLAADPDELRDVSAQRPEALEHLGEVLEQMRARGLSRARAAPSALDPDLIEQLEALGYLGGEP